MIYRVQCSTCRAFSQAGPGDHARLGRCSRGYGEHRYSVDHRNPHAWDGHAGQWPHMWHPCTNYLPKEIEDDAHMA